MFLSYLALDIFILLYYYNLDYPPLEVERLELLGTRLEG